MREYRTGYRLLVRYSEVLPTSTVVACSAMHCVICLVNCWIVHGSDVWIFVSLCVGAVCGSVNYIYLLGLFWYGNRQNKVYLIT